MSDNSDSSPWKNPAIWGRIVFTVLFLLLFALIIGPLMIILGVVQAVFTIFTGEDNRNLRDLSAAAAQYVNEILLFATWNREQKPFPFSEFPKFEEDEGSATVGEDAVVTEPEAEADTPAVAEAEPSAAGKKKAAPKKTTRRKSSTGKTASSKTED